MALVLDTGVLYAALDGSDPDHASCDRLIQEAPEQLIIPAPVFVELDYWVRKFATVDVWLAFCQDVEAGAYAIYPLDRSLLVSAAAIQSQYSDLPLGLVDAAVMATCEVLGEPKVATLDRRHFGVVRMHSGRPLDMVPDQ